MSEHDPELRAFKELETLVRHLGEELASFRRRAIAAEAQLRDGGAAPAPAAAATRERISTSHSMSEIEAENEALRTRLHRAEERVKQMLDRVRFLRQQLQAQATAGAHP